MAGRQQYRTIHSIMTFCFRVVCMVEYTVLLQIECGKFRDGARFSFFCCFKKCSDYANILRRSPRSNPCLKFDVLHFRMTERGASFHFT